MSDVVKLTGETITDEQCREEADSAWQHWVDTQHAMGRSSQPGRFWPSAEQQRAARYRLAERINARNGASS